MVASMTLSVQLLGSFRVSRGEHTLLDERCRQRRAASLVKLLALAPGHRLHREQVLDVLWPELDPQAAANNLNYTVHTARKLLGGTERADLPFLRREGEYLALGPTEHVQVDVVAFEAAVKEARRTGAVAAYERALGLYAGELLPADRYEEWVTERRESLQTWHLALLRELARLRAEAGEHPGAIETLERLLAVEPVDEAGHVGLMRQYALVGERSRALAQYQRLKTVLERELDAEPDAASQRLYEAIRAGAFPEPSSSTLEGSAAAPTIAVESVAKQLVAAPRDDGAVYHQSPFVGRQRELALLKETLERARAGHGSMVMIGGEPGIGKTRIAEELSELARQRGMIILWGRCYQNSGAPAYWPWIQVLRALFAQYDQDTLRARMGPGASDLSQLLPELRIWWLDLEPTALEGEIARFRLFDSMTTFLRALAGERGMLIVLDDLQWADRSSLLMLEFLSRESRDSRLLGVGLYRDIEVTPDHALATTLVEVSRQPVNRHVALTGLDEAEVEHMIAVLSDYEVSAELAGKVTERTSGNPFFVREIVGFLDTTRASDASQWDPAWHLVIPSGIRELIRQRLDRLSSPCREVLATASVIGREFELRVLQGVSDDSVEMLLDLLDEAVQAQFVRPLDGATPVYRFVHDVMRETIYDSLRPSRRVRLHEQVGLVLERLHTADLAPHYAQLAHHFAVAVPAGTLAQAVDYTVRAGDQAASQLAWESAIQQYEGALDLLDQLAQPDHVLRCDLLLAMGEARRSAGVSYGYSPVASETFQRAAEAARSIGSAERLARAALGFAGPNPFMVFGELEQIELLEEALARLDNADSLLRARLLARLGADLRILPGTAERSLDLTDAAVAMAYRLGSPPDIAYTTLFRHQVHWSPDNLEQRRADAETIRQHVSCALDSHTRFLGMMLEVGDLLESGDAPRARAAHDAFVEEISRLRLEGMMKSSFSRGVQVMWFMMDGEIESAVTLLEEQIEILNHPAGYFRPFCWLRREQGRGPEVVPMLDSWIRRDGRKIPLVRQYRTYRLLSNATGGDHAAARSELWELASNGLKEIPRDRYWLNHMAVLAEVVHILHEQALADDIYALLAPFADRVIVNVPGWMLHGPTHHFLGLLASTLERWEGAEHHLQHALAMNESMGARPFAAYTQVAWADMLLRRGEPADRERAREMLERAIAAAADMGTLYLHQQASRLLKHLGKHENMVTDRPHESRGVQQPHGLSSRELEVLRLVADGLPDREIADRLFISPRTVQTHVTNILNKLGVSSRAAAAAQAVRDQLI
jgi:DNA-binding SARP family transcriptional activator/DNA-binding CsgD family transcriptional regulator